ncbi:MAG: tetratricopeptide repeat protein [Spirochaetes bacterium]|nr:tetratricopeptide repeat protein [Spirochaetota bacterium]
MNFSITIIISLFVALFFISGIFVYNYITKRIKLKNAQIDMKKGVNSEAEKKLLEMIAEHPDEKEAYENLVTLYFKNEEFSKALVVLEKALDNPTLLKLWGQENILFLAGLAAKNNKKYQKALKYFLTIYGLNNNNNDVLKQLAVIYHLLKDYQKADSFFQKVYSMRDKVKLDKEFVKYFGINCYKLGRVMDTIKILEQYITKYPNDIEANFYLGISLYSESDYEKSKEYLKKAIVSKENRHEAMLALANIFFVQNDLKASEFLLLKILEDSDVERKIFLEACYILGELYVKNGKIENAVLYWNKIIAINSEYKDVSIKLSKYSSLSSDNIIKEFSLSDKQKFINISKKLAIRIVGKCKINNVEILDDETIDVVINKQVKTKNVIILLRIVKDTNSVGELVVKDLYLKAKELKAPKSILITVGPLSPSARDYIATRPIEYFDRSYLNKILRELNASKEQ